MDQEDTRGLGAARLRLLTSLPRGHQNYFFEAIRKLCLKHASVGARTVGQADRDSEAAELFSEVMAKLLGATGMEQNGNPQPTRALSEELAGHDDPKRDARVAWLIESVGGSQALAHRQEDIRRRRHGGKWRNDGYRHVQLEEEHLENAYIDPDDPHEDDDTSRVWLGLLLAAKKQFKPNEDVSVLLRLLAHDENIRACFGSEWPVRVIADALNKTHTSPRWTDDRVDNAKKRLKNWIARLKREQNLDSADLMAVFAGLIPRQLATAKQVRPEAVSPAQLLSPREITP